MTEGRDCSCPEVVRRGRKCLGCCGGCRAVVAAAWHSGNPGSIGLGVTGRMTAAAACTLPALRIRVCHNVAVGLMGC